MAKREKEPTVYPCTYRELARSKLTNQTANGISLYLQGTQLDITIKLPNNRYIPVPTGNSRGRSTSHSWQAVYPCTYRELT